MSCSSSPSLLLICYNSNSDYYMKEWRRENLAWLRVCSFIDQERIIFCNLKSNFTDEWIQGPLSYIHLLCNEMLSGDTLSSRVQCRIDLVDRLTFIIQEEEQWYHSMVEYTSKEWEYPTVMCSMIMEYLYPSALCLYAMELIVHVPSISTLYEDGKILDPN